MPTNNTVLLEYNTKAVTTVNVSNTESTLFVSVEPNANVSLQLVLAAGSPPNKTHFSHTTTLSPTGNTHIIYVSDIKYFIGILG